jgi:hypothetical protein
MRHGLIGLTCIYTTNETDIGLSEGSKTEHARLRLESTNVPRTGGRVFAARPESSQATTK